MHHARLKSVRQIRDSGVLIMMRLSEDFGTRRAIGAKERYVISRS